MILSAIVILCKTKKIGRRNAKWTCSIEFTVERVLISKAKSRSGEWRVVGLVPVFYFRFSFSYSSTFLLN